MTPRSAAEQEPRTRAGQSLLRQWSGHVNEPEVRIVVLAIEAEATAAVPLDAPSRCVCPMCEHHMSASAIKIVAAYMLDDRLSADEEGGTT